MTGLQRQLEKLCATDETNSAKILRELVAKIRPGWFRGKRVGAKRVEALVELLSENEAYRKAVRQHVTEVLKAHSLALYTEAGILANEGFFAEMVRKLGNIFLPPPPDTTEIRDAFNYIFYKRHDYVWVQLISDDVLADLFSLIFPKEELEVAEPQTLHRYYDSLEVLVHRATSIGLHPQIISRYPRLRRSDNPVLTLNRSLIAMVEQLRTEGRSAIARQDFDGLREQIDSCVRLVHDVRKGQHETGASLSLTYMLQRLRQHLARIRTFLEMLENHHDVDDWRIQTALFKQLVRYENARNSVKELFFKNIGFLAYQITEHGGKTGEHYITHGREDYRRMLWSSMGGGLIVGFLSLIKVGVYYLKLSPFGTAFLYSMNYSFGFIGIHITHSTLATKQPAMTASRIAAALDEGNNGDAGMKSLSGLIVKTFRSQFIAFMGNMFIAFPVAFLAAYGWYMVYGSHIAGEEKAWKLVHELHPWESLSLFHAGIAGVCLFLAGIISGYYDNAVVYRKLPDRIYHHPLLRRITPKGLRRGFSNYIGNNLGSLAGNFFLGIMLGSIGTLGYIFGLPIDIRHITFASGNFGLAVAAIGPYISWSTIGITVLGILLIGFMNFIVSFSLAIFVATQSRRVSFSKSRVLLLELLRHFFRAPSEFLFPPSEEEEPHEDAADVAELAAPGEEEHPAGQADEAPEKSPD